VVHVAYPSNGFPSPRPPAATALAPASLAIPLAPDFVDYLLADGVRLPVPPGALLPADPRFVPARRRSDSASSTSSEGSSEQATSAAWARAAGLLGASGGSDSDGESSSGGSADGGEPPSFPALEQRISDALEELGGAAFVKLNWSAPVDAVSIAGSLKATTPGAVFLLLKSSDMITHDLTAAFDRCAPAAASAASAASTGSAAASAPAAVAVAPPPRVTPTLVLRKWCNLHRSNEWRCFVQRGSLVAACQRDCGTFFPFLSAQSAAVAATLGAFYLDVAPFAPASHDASYVMDVYVDTRGRPRLIDFNVFGGSTDPLMFTWEELAALPPPPAGTPPLLRLVCSHDDVRTNVGDARTARGLSCVPIEMIAAPAELRNAFAGFEELLKGQAVQPPRTSTSSRLSLPTPSA
jgi:hypothetical protein